MKNRSSAFGFTLMELILVIVLLSILSLYAASRFMGTASISAYALQEQAISVIRQVQVNRMQSNVDDEDTNFILKVSGSCIGSKAACDMNKTQRESRSDYVADPQAVFELSGGTSPIEFNLLGNPLESASAGVSILIRDKSGGSRCRVDINSQGYVSEGECS
ncbi:type II secretion system protein [Vibrio alfacsensis]|uniref:type II secretion system protein n=1 Tax=Vibrio alfacsensis TaxID=1074311 RepID=UPI002ADDBF39|nr:type II secretion system protein [Vibrio alfacsensis]WQE75903.1 type II secretion system protein [Vibrio alfacsensis]